MGKIQCKSANKHQELLAIIESKLENKDTPLDKKLHSEYLRIVGLFGKSNLGFRVNFLFILEF